MRRFAAAVAAALFASTMISDAQVEQSVPTLENEASGLWFVELSGAPTVEGTDVATLEREEADFHRAAAGQGIPYTEGRHFRKLWNGLTVRASNRDVSKLRAIPGVQSVYPVVKVTLAQQEEEPGAVADLVTAIHMTGADILQNDLGLIGRGVTVAVMDTGIDYNHPDLGGCFGRNCRVTRGFDLVGDDFDSSSPDPARQVPHPDPDPDDCDGHGTHVSGIIGANGGVKGVAPGVEFHAYRVFGCQGSTSAEILLAAMEMVLDDGADVLNMSIGSALTWPQYPTAKGANQLVKHGVVVVASIGNEGALGLYGAASPGIGKDVIGVASFDNTHANVISFTISPDGTRVGYIAAAGAPTPPVTGSFPMARTGTATIANDACNVGTPPVSPLPPGSLTGKVALIRRGTCSFYEKSFNAQSAGAAGVVLYNNAPGFVSPTVAGTPPITIPVASISAAKGVLIDSRLASPVTMTWTSLIASEPQANGGLISSFSSYGLPPDLSFKPDIGVPGGSIRSTLPLERGGYGNLSGTSMASPHVAGAVALLLEARPGTKPKEVERRLQNTARPAVWSGNPALGFLDNVHRQGAGMLRIDDAVKAHATISPSSLALGEVGAGAVTNALKISLAAEKRRGPGRDDPPVTYTLSHVPVLSTGPNTFTPSFRTGFAAVTFSPSSITLGGLRGHDDDEANVFVTITAPTADPASRLFGGYIVFTPSDAGTVLRVPYGGYNGDYQQIVGLTPTPFGFPWLAKVSGGFLVNQPGGAAFTLVGDDIPFILVHLDHQVRDLKMEVINLVTGQPVGFADIEEFLPRNSVATSFFAFTWDGTTMKRAGGRLRTVPNGSYRLELSVLKALGDPDDSAHTEHWPSPTIVISRPAP